MKASSSSSSSSSSTSSSSSHAGLGGTGSFSAGMISQLCLLKEIIVQRDPPLVLVFNLVEQGRRVYRELCYSSDTRHSFDTSSQKRLDEEGVFASSSASLSSFFSSSREEQEGKEGYHHDRSCFTGRCESFSTPQITAGLPSAFPMTGWRGPVSLVLPSSSSQRGEGGGDSSGVCTPESGGGLALRGEERAISLRRGTGKNKNDFYIGWPSLVVSRHLSSVNGEEIYISTRFLRVSSMPR